MKRTDGPPISELTADQRTLVAEACRLRAQHVSATEVARVRGSLSRVQMWRLEGDPTRATARGAERYVQAVCAALASMGGPEAAASDRLRTAWDQSWRSGAEPAHVGARVAALLARRAIPLRTLADAAGVSIRTAQRFVQQGTRSARSLDLMDALLTVTHGDAEAVALRDVVRGTPPSGASGPALTQPGDAPALSRPIEVVTADHHLVLRSGEFVIDLSDVPLPSTWNPHHPTTRTPPDEGVWRRIVAEALASGVRPHAWIDEATQGRWVETALRDPLFAGEPPRLLPALRGLPARDTPSRLAPSVVVRSNALDSLPEEAEFHDLCSSLAAACAAESWTLRVDLDGAPWLDEDSLVITMRSDPSTEQTTVASLLDPRSLLRSHGACPPAGIHWVVAPPSPPSRGWNLTPSASPYAAALSAQVVALAPLSSVSARALVGAAHAARGRSVADAALRISDALLDPRGRRTALVWSARPSASDGARTGDPDADGERNRTDLLVGRGNLLHRALQALHSTTGYGLALLGPGGIGKSAVASAVADRLSARRDVLYGPHGATNALELLQRLIEEHRRLSATMATWEGPEQTPSAKEWIRAWVHARRERGARPLLIVVEDPVLEDPSIQELLQSGRELAPEDRMILTVRTLVGEPTPRLPSSFAIATLSGLDASHAAVLARLRLTQTGGFSSAAAGALDERFLACGGNPRLIGLLASSMEQRADAGFTFTPAAPLGGPRTLVDAETLRDSLLHAAWAKTPSPLRSALAEIASHTADIPISVLEAVVATACPEAPAGQTISTLVSHGWLHEAASRGDGPRRTYAQHPWTSEGLRRARDGAPVDAYAEARAAAHAWNAYAHEEAIVAPARSVLAWKEARAAALRGGDLPLADGTLLPLRRTLQTLGRSAEAAAMLEALTTDDQPVSTRGRASIELAHLFLFEGQLDAAQHALDRVERWLVGTPGETLLWPALRAARAHIAFRRGRVQDALDGWLRAAEEEGGQVDPMESFSWRNNAATCLLRLRDREGARAQWESARAFAAAHGIVMVPEVQRQLTMLELTLLRDEGRCVEAAALARACLDDATGSQRVRHRLWMLGLLTSAWMGQRRWNEALEAAAQQYREAREAGSHPAARNAAAKARAIARQLGDGPAATTWQDAFWRRWADAPDRPEEIYGLLEDGRRARMVCDLTAWRAAVAQATALADDDRAPPDARAMLWEQHAQLAERDGDRTAAAAWRERIPAGLRDLPDWED